jgi:hypothetical protein
MKRRIGKYIQRIKITKMIVEKDEETKLRRIEYKTKEKLRTGRRSRKARRGRRRKDRKVVAVCSIRIYCSQNYHSTEADLSRLQNLISLNLFIYVVYLTIYSGY